PHLVHSAVDAGHHASPLPQGSRPQTVGLVAVAAPNPEGDARAHDTGSGDPAVVDRVAERQVAETRGAHVAHRREPGLEGLLGVSGAEQRKLGGALGEPAVLPVAVADGAPHEVHVGVDEAGQHRLAREVDDRRAAGNRHVGADGGDALAPNQDDGVLDRRPAAAVDERARPDRGDRDDRGLLGDEGERNKEERQDVRDSHSRRLSQASTENRQPKTENGYLNSFPNNPPPPRSSPCATAVSASANSVAVGNRSSGLVASERARAFSRLAGRSGRTWRSVWGVPRRRAIIISWALRP